MAVPIILFLDSSSQSTAAGSGGGAADPDGDRGGDDNDGRSTTVAVNLQVVLQQQMELTIKSFMTQLLSNCMNDKSMLAAIKSKMAVFECSSVRVHGQNGDTKTAKRKFYKC